MEHANNSSCKERSQKPSRTTDVSCTVHCKLKDKISTMQLKVASKRCKIWAGQKVLARKFSALGTCESKLVCAAHILDAC